MTELIIIIVTVGIVLFLMWGFKLNKEMTEKVKNETRLIIGNHIETLRVKRLQKRQFDDYGNVIEEPWGEEISYFYDNVVIPTLLGTPGIGRDILRTNKQIDKRFKPENTYLHRYTLYQMVNAEIDAYELEKPDLRLDVSSMSPGDFESYCVQLLNESGWHATTTRASGDQGIDILATWGDKKAVFQCKKYSSPVGNKAVQEAIAGRTYASADYAFVVSNTDFTPSAIELANKSGVHLVHYTSLSDLSQYL